MAGQSTAPGRHQRRLLRWPRRTRETRGPLAALLALRLQTRETPRSSITLASVAHRLGFSPRIVPNPGDKKITYLCCINVKSNHNLPQLKPNKQVPAHEAEPDRVPSIGFAWWPVFIH